MKLAEQIGRYIAKRAGWRAVSRLPWWASLAIGVAVVALSAAVANAAPPEFTFTNSTGYDGLTIDWDTETNSGNPEMHETNGFTNVYSLGLDDEETHTIQASTFHWSSGDWITFYATFGANEDEAPVELATETVYVNDDTASFDVTLSSHGSFSFIPNVTFNVTNNSSEVTTVSLQTFAGGSTWNTADTASSVATGGGTDTITFSAGLLGDGGASDEGNSGEVAFFINPAGCSGFRYNPSGFEPILGQPSQEIVLSGDPCADGDDSVSSTIGDPSFLAYEAQVVYENDGFLTKRVTVEKDSGGVITSETYTLAPGEELTLDYESDQDFSLNVYEDTVGGDGGLSITPTLVESIDATENDVEEEPEGDTVEQSSVQGNALDNVDSSLVQDSVTEPSEGSRETVIDTATLDTNQEQRFDESKELWIAISDAQAERDGAILEALGGIGDALQNQGDGSSGEGLTTGVFTNSLSSSLTDLGTEAYTPPTITPDTGLTFTLPFNELEDSLPGGVTLADKDIDFSDPTLTAWVEGLRSLVLAVFTYAFIMRVRNLAQSFSGM